MHRIAAQYVELVKTFRENDVEKSRIEFFTYTPAHKKKKKSGPSRLGKSREFLRLSQIARTIKGVVTRGQR